MAPHVRTAARLLCAATLGFAAVSGAAGTAGAATYAYKLYDGGPGYTGPFAGPGTVYDLTKSLAFDTAAAGSTANLKPEKGDYVAERMTFGGGARPTLTATAGAMHVWQDIAPAYGGLGVGNAFLESGHDEVDGTDILRLSFDAPLHLRGVGTLFVDVHEEENFTSTTSSSSSKPKKKAKRGKSRIVKANTVRKGGRVNFTRNPPRSIVRDNLSLYDSMTFLLAVDGGPWRTVSMKDANSMLLDFYGSVFEFKQASGSQDFYLSAMIVNAPVPGAALLFLTGLGGIAAAGKLKRGRAAA
jgi:hypothetical protein